MKRLSQLLLISLLFGTSSVQAAEAVGKVGYLSGALVIQRPDGTLKILGPKSPVYEGDVLVTAKDSYAQIQMNDGAKLTLRPNSNLKIESFHFDEKAPQSDSSVMNLLKGGFRTVTGLIGKRGNSDAYRIRTRNATIGIRGTDYSSRLCATKGCQDEDEVTNKPVTAKAIPSQVIGRVMVVQGELSAKDKEGKERKLAPSVPIYEGDTLSTGNKSFGVVAFRDESRITLQENTHFAVEAFKFDKATNEESAVMRLLKGGVRVVTGLIGRVRHDNFQFKVSTATIGIRGTGFDAWCNAACADGLGSAATEDKPLDGIGVYVWQGSVELGSGCTGGSCAAMQLVTLQQAAIIAQGTGQPVLIKVVPPGVTNNPAPMPNTIPVDMQKLFGSESSTDEAGLYVTVHDGHVILTQGDKALDLYRSDSGYANNTTLMLLPNTPAFMGGDSPVDENISSTTGKHSVPTAGCVVGQ